MEPIDRMRASALFDARAHAKAAAAYEERITELRSLLKAVRMDGMPRGGSPGDPTGRRIALIDDLERSAARERAATEEARKRAERLITKLPPAKLIFCRAYYLDGLTLEEAARIADRSPRQCIRYCREIFGSVGMSALPDGAPHPDD